MEAMAVAVATRAAFDSDSSMMMRREVGVGWDEQSGDGVWEEVMRRTR